MRLTGLFAGLALLFSVSTANAGEGEIIDDIALLITGKVKDLTAGQAFIDKDSAIGPLQYGVCGTCPVGLCVDPFTGIDPIGANDVVIRTTIFNTTIGNSKEKDAAGVLPSKKTSVKYQQKGDKKTGGGPSTFIEFWGDDGLEVDGVPVPFSACLCDGEPFKGDLKVDAKANKLKGKGKGKSQFENIFVACDCIDEDGLETEASAAAIALLCDKNKVVKYQKNGKGVSIKVNKGTVIPIEGFDL